MPASSPMVGAIKIPDKLAKTEPMHQDQRRMAVGLAPEPLDPLEGNEVAKERPLLALDRWAEPEADRVGKNVARSARAICRACPR